MKNTASFCGGQKGHMWQITLLVLDKKIPDRLIKFILIERLKLQLDQVFDLGLVS